MICPSYLLPIDTDLTYPVRCDHLRAQRQLLHFFSSQGVARYGQSFGLCSMFGLRRERSGENIMLGMNLNRFAFVAVAVLSCSSALSPNCNAQTVIRSSSNGSSVTRYGTSGTINGVPIRVNGVLPGSYGGNYSRGGGGTTFRLYDVDNIFREKAKVNNSKLEIFSNGVIYRYLRNSNYDNNRGYAFYNTTYDKLIRWPLSNSGRLGIGERNISGGFSWRLGHHIGPRPRRSQPSNGQSGPSVVVIQPIMPSSSPSTGGNIASVPSSSDSDPTPLAEPTRLSRPVRVKLANSQVSELWVLLEDQRLPEDPVRIKIPPKEFVTIEVQDGGGLQQQFLSLSVYRLQRQSMVIDRTKPGPGVVTEENYSPKSIGWIEIPLKIQEEGGTMDVYRRATSRHNPGRVTRIDPELWRSQEPMVNTTVPDPPIGVGVSEGLGDDADGPFGVAQPQGTPVNSTPLSPFLSTHNSLPNVPLDWPCICFLNRDSAGTMHVESIQVQASKQAGARTQSLVTTYKQEISSGQGLVFLPDGSQLSDAAANAALQSEVPAVLVNAHWGQKLDANFLPLLKPTTPIVVSFMPFDEQEHTPSMERRQQLPTTLIQFLGIQKSAAGDLQLLSPYAEAIEQTYTVEVPYTEEQIVDGKASTVEKTRTETRTRTVEVNKARSEAITATSHRLYNMAGKKLSSADIQDSQGVVFVAAGDIVDPWYRQLLRPETILVMESKK